ncbi:PE-PPE domain-containing protein [Mycolicibacterium sp. 3033]|nr:PE-PPE domain-containing protein [Mycolicibacterium aurantiacum]
MKRATKAVVTAAALPIAATLPLTFGGGALPAAAAAAASAASSVIPPGPATVLHHGPTPWDMADNLGGALCDAPKVCREVRYDWIQPYGPIEFGVKENVARLDWAIDHTGTDPKIVYSFSGGARIASVWLQDHAKDKDAPAPDELSFVLLGNGGRKYGGVNGWFWGDLLRTPTDTQYDIVDVAGEYDPIADFPTNPFNLLAVANGVAAFVYVHLRYDEVDLDDPDNIVWKEGKTTYVYVPTEHLPLLQGFYDMGLGSLVADIEPKLREIVDRAYDRTWLEGKPTQGELAAAAGTSPASAADPGARSLVRTADTTETTTPSEAGAEHQSTRPDAASTDSPSVEAPESTSESTTESSDDAGETDAEPGSATSSETSGPKHRMPLRGFLQAAEAELAKKADEAKTATEDGDKDTTKGTDKDTGEGAADAGKSDSTSTVNKAGTKASQKKTQTAKATTGAASSSTGGGGHSED